MIQILVTRKDASEPPISYLFRIGLAAKFDQPGAVTITFVSNVPGWYHGKFLSTVFSCWCLLFFSFGDAMLLNALCAT